MGALDLGDGGAGALGHGRTTSVPAALSGMRAPSRTASDLQAGGPDGWENASSETGRWVAASTAAWGWQVGGEHLVELGGIDGEPGGGPGPVGIGQRDLGGGQGAVGGAGGHLGEALALVGGERGDEDEANDVGEPGGGVGDHRAAVGVADGQDRPG